MAVTNPMMYAPNQSIRLLDARRMPLMAKANVPEKSRNVVKSIVKYQFPFNQPTRSTSISLLIACAAGYAVQVGVIPKVFS